MRKARTDADTVRQSLIAAAERMLQETDGRRLVMSEIAARVGLTQSHAHSFFATKDDLVRALAARWFEGVERELEAVAGWAGPPAEKLRRYVLTSLRIKRAKFDENPDLFRAYLALAAEHDDLVRSHAGRLYDILRRIVAEIVPAHEADNAARLAHDATVLFRVPHTIAMFRAWATDERAGAVVDALAAALSSGKKPD